MKNNLIFLSIVGFLFSGAIFLQSDSSNYEKLKIENKPLTKSLLTQNVSIIDIRTPQEWHETGVIPNSHLITFYNEDQSFDEKAFIKSIASLAKKDDMLVILCRSGNRSLKVSHFLASQGYTHVINLSGGIKEAFKNGVSIVPYK